MAHSFEAQDNHLKPTSEGDVAYLVILLMLIFI